MRALTIPRPLARVAQQGGVSITPAIVEKTARRRGTIGSVTIKNTTKDTMRVTVNVRPSIPEPRPTCSVVLNTRASLSPYVRSSPATFNLRAGPAHGEAENGAG